MSGTLTSCETNNLRGKIKAIYPHIVVTGSPLKPCYSIEWYDVEKGEMIHGYSSFSLPIVYRWMKEDFEIIEEDIDHFIRTKNDEIKALLHSVKSLSGQLSSVRSESVKEFAYMLQERCNNQEGCLYLSDIGAVLNEWESEHK